ncbi:GL11670 [Drosophila persimilis]|uniref:GL11670 n=1 Tax=Drosophila persimilis TaxID=7234 RepID=B4GCS3_DROPE|nr:protein kinase 4 [Drosophila persimilis]EDW32486.1 GL11670 [Drosophila persimilis]
MAPFKLKFRMGSSRSTSQEHDPDPQVNEALLGNQQHQQQQHQQQQELLQQHVVEASSSSSLDLADCNGLGPMSSERKLLLPQNKALNLNSNSMRYLNQSRTPCINESLTDTDADILPTTPPPSYEHVLEEDTRLSQHQRQVSLDSAATPNQNSRRSSVNSSRHSAAHLSAALEEQLEGGNSSSSTSSSLCNDPDCQQNQQNLNQNYSHCGGSNISNSNNNNNNNEGDPIAEGVFELEQQSDTEFDCPEDDLNTISVSEFLLETEMAASSRCPEKLYAGEEDGDDADGQCTDDQCAQCSEERGAQGEEGALDGDEASTSSQAAAFYDPLLNRGSYNYNEGGNSNSRPVSSNSQQCQEACCVGSASGSVASRSRSGRRQQQLQQQHQQPNCHTNLLTPEMMSNKTSKEIYKDLAKQWGITCKMSESCRCMDCQSNYFDCDYDDNEHHKTDGGLGAGTPMFISEVMHGSGCTIL